jgi:hypothetical protein
MSRRREDGYEDEPLAQDERRLDDDSHVGGEREYVDEPTHRERETGASTRHDPDGPVATRRGVDVRDERITVDRTRSDVGVREARRGFGGFDLPATLVGMLTALALLILLAGLVGAAIGAIGYQMGVEGREQQLSIAGLAGGLIVLFVAFFVGGWAAARIARYDGVLNGVMTAVWVLVLGAILAGLGAWLGSEYDVLRNVEAPQFFSRDALTVGGIVSGVLALAAMLGGGALGGRRGERYHREIDATIVGTRDGGLER